MSALSKQLREEYTWKDCNGDFVEPVIDPNVIALCDEVEELEDVLRDMVELHEDEPDRPAVARAIEMLGAKP